MSPAMLEIPQYYAWLFEQFRAHLGRTVLDVGTGPGIHLPFLKGRRVIATDLSAECLADVRRRFPWVETVQADASDDALTGRLSDRGIDTITCLNVLEHIPSDSRALTIFRAILEPRGGRLILVVPAHQALYGSLDRLADHLRRYSLRDLRDQLGCLGFRVLEARHFNIVGGIGWYLNARLLRVKNLGAASVNRQIRFFGAYLLPVARVADAVFGRAFRVPFGQSLIAVATPSVRAR
jgi:SAM-dependent methyltransferase